MIEEKRGYISGLIGGILGGFIATIPWIFVYVYGNMILSLMAILIALGVLKGYQLFHGKIDEKLPTIIIVISCLCITISTLIIIPMMLMNKENIEVNFSNLKLLYNDSTFKAAILKDYIISLFFTFLGISGVVGSVRRQIDENENENEIKISLINNTLNQEVQEQKEQVKQVFLDLNAMDKYHAISKEEVLCSLEEKAWFGKIRRMGIIKKYKGKYYYSLKDEKSPLKRFLKLYFKIMGVIILIFLLCLVIFL